jgi:plastocyanin
MGKPIAIVAIAVLVAAFAALGAGVASGDGLSAAGTKTVAVGDDFFKPHKFTIAKNTIVKWAWSSQNADDHQIAEADKHFEPKSKGFESKDQTTGAPFRHRYKKAGTFYVICLVHPTDMRMKIVVKP